MQETLEKCALRLAGMIVPECTMTFRSQDDVEALGTSLRNVNSARIGESRRGQALVGWQFGRGTRSVSVVAGCHADEPVGPMAAQVLPTLLEVFFPELLDRYRFVVVPQMNPDGADDNRAWFADPPAFSNYVGNVVREKPGDDLEFGFGGEAPRPEAAGAMAFLREHGPYCAHFSLHGMGFGEGAWFLICREWIERSAPVRHVLRKVCEHAGLGMHDVERHGEKGFERIEEGYCTTPLATAMRSHFVCIEQPEVARRFQPTSMEFVQSLGGDPFCGVTEMPLFLVGRPREDLVDTPTQRLRRELETAVKVGEPLDDLASRYRLRALPVELQIRMQVAFLVLTLAMLAEAIDA